MSADAIIVANSDDKAILRRMSKANSGHYFVRALAEFSEIAKLSGDRPIGEFVHHDPEVAVDITEFAEEHKIDPKWTDYATYDQWHEPTDGLASIHSILSYLEEHPDFVDARFQFFVKDPSRPRINPNELLFELAEFEKELKYLQKKQVKFRFEVG